METRETKVSDSPVKEAPQSTGLNDSPAVQNLLDVLVSNIVDEYVISIHTAKERSTP